jgi:two-component system KDP operon response regulator KdpE
MTDATHLVLTIEDDRGIQKVLRVLFEANGFRVAAADTAARGEHDARLHRPDVVVVDLGLPDGGGLNVIAGIRAWSPMPIIVLSARTDEASRVAAFENGADDYVTKPFSAPELVARVRAILRRHARGALPMGVLELGDVSVDLGRRLARRRDGRALHLTPLEHRILETLVRHGDRVVSHSTLIKEVWGPHRDDARALRVYIGTLRRKLEADPCRPRHILTEPGIGYRLTTERQSPVGAGGVAPARYGGGSTDPPQRCLMSRRSGRAW